MHVNLLLSLVLVVSACNVDLFGGEPEQPSCDGPSCAAISVTTDKRSYEPGGVIAVVVANDSDAPVTTYDQQAFCSIIRLERQRDDEWDEVRNCLSAVPSEDVTIAPHSRRQIELKPSAPADALPAGTYRATLVFTPGEDFSLVDPSAVSSDPFHVR